MQSTYVRKPVIKAFLLSLGRRYCDIKLTQSSEATVFRRYYIICKFINICCKYKNDDFYFI